MTSKLLSEILTEHGQCERDGKTYKIPPSTSASLYASLALEPIIIERVESFTLESEICIVATSRRESFFVAYEDVRALRLHAS